MNFHQLFTSQQSGPACFINCRSCGAAIREHFDHAAGHGVLGYSGHKDDCDFILAGLTVDLDKQDAADEKAAFDAATPAEKKVYVEMKTAEELEASQHHFGDAYMCGYFARLAIHYKRRERNKHV